MKAKLNYISGMRFEAHVGSGHTIVMDSSPAVGGEDLAARPMEHFLVSIAGCTGMDVVSILRKMRVEFSSMAINIEAERAANHPKVFKKVDIEYMFHCDSAAASKIEKAIELSQQHYCSASAMVRAAAEVSYSFKIIQ